MERAKPSDAIDCVQRGLRGTDEGTGEEAKDVFAALERELGIAEQNPANIDEAGES